MNSPYMRCRLAISGRAETQDLMASFLLFVTPQEKIYYSGR